MKRILFILPFDPYPLKSGGHQGIYNGISILKGVADVTITYITTQSNYRKNKPYGISHALPWVKTIPFIEPASKHTFRWYIRTVKAALHKKLHPQKEKEVEGNSNTNATPTLNLPHCRADYTAFIKRIIKDKLIDIVQVESVEFISIAHELRHVKTIFVHHELLFVRTELALIAEKRDEKERNRVVEILKKEEIDSLNLYNTVITLSETDAEKLLSSGLTTNVLPSISVVNRPNPSNIHLFQPNVLTFVGPSWHYPNLDGIQWFIDECWRSIKDKIPNIKLKIIGEWSEPHINTLSIQDSNIEFLGFVDNLTSAISGTIMIVPVRIGSGIRMKILEASTIGVPVVSTTIGAEGLPIHNRVDIQIADNPEEFANAIIALQEETLYRSIASNCKLNIASKYTPEALLKNRISLYQ